MILQLSLGGRTDRRVVEVLGFTTLLISQVISVAFYSERETSDKFCSEALISTCGSFMCHKSTTSDRRLYFPSEGSHTQNFYALKNLPTTAEFEPANPSDPVASMITTGPPSLREKRVKYMIISQIA